MGVWIEKRWRVDFTEDGRQGSVTRGTYEAARAEERRLRATAGAHHVSQTPKGGSLFRVVWRSAAGRKRTMTFGKRGDGLDAAAARVAAEDYRAEVRADLRRGGFPDPKRGEQAFEAYWERFLERRRDAGRAEATLALYAMLGRRYILPAFGGLSINSIQVKDVEAWTQKLERAGVGDATRSAAFRALRTALNQAKKKDRIIDSNPTEGVDAPSPGTEERRPLEVAQVHAIADVIHGRFRALVLLLGYTGLRIGEAAALRVEDLHLPDDEHQYASLTIRRALTEVGGVVRFGETKNRRERTVWLNASMLEVLREHLDTYPRAHDDEGRALVFASPEGTPLRPRNFRRRAWDESLQQAGLGEWEIVDGRRRFRPRFHVHDLRHSHASWLGGLRVPIAAVSSRLGHSSTIVTQRVYSHSMPSLDALLVEGLEETFRAARGEGAPPPPPAKGGKVVPMAREQRRRSG